MVSGYDEAAYAQKCKKQCPSGAKKPCASLYIPQCKDSNECGGAGAYTRAVCGVSTVLAAANDVECVIFE
jgi:hypothetical protein